MRQRGTWQAAAMALLAFTLGGCAVFAPKPTPRATYRAGYLVSSDGLGFHPAVDLLSAAEKAAASCRAIDRGQAVSAHYVIENPTTGIRVMVKSCESSADNCAELEKCLTQRPVAWITRFSGAANGLLGPEATNWPARCGGAISVLFILAPQSGALPSERVACAEPRHEGPDATQELFQLGKASARDLPPASPEIEELLRRWDGLVFGR